MFKLGLGSCDCLHILVEVCFPFVGGIVMPRRTWQPLRSVWRMVNKHCMLIAGRQIAWCVMAGCPDADLRKLQYALDKCAEEYQFDETVPLDPAVDEAIKWQAARTPTEVIQQREEMMQKLEEANAALWKSGTVFFLV